MKIAVCFKLIADYEQVPAENWKAGGLLHPKAGFTGEAYVKKVFGFFDEGALESALRLKDSCPATRLEAISLGKEDEIYTSSLHAAGFDKVTYLEAESDFDSENTAKALSEYIKGQGFDLVLCGESAGPLDSGTVPYLMAKYLNCRLVNKISEIKSEGEGLILTRETSDKIESYRLDTESSKPLIAVLSDAKYPYLRFSSYEKKEQTKHMKASCHKAANGKTKARFELPKEKLRSSELIDMEKLAELLQEYAGGDKS